MMQIYSIHTKIAKQIHEIEDYKFECIIWDFCHDRYYGVALVPSVIQIICVQSAMGVGPVRASRA